MRVRTSERGSKLDAFKDYLRERFDRYQLSAVRLIEEIRPMGYTGSLQTVRRFLQSLRGPAQRLEWLTVRYETPPGKQAQAAIRSLTPLVLCVAPGRGTGRHRPPAPQVAKSHGSLETGTSGH